MDNENRIIRKPAVAGMFYPGNAVELTKVVAGLFAEVGKAALDGPPIGLIAPHAGYPYSGKTAAKAFKLLEGFSFDTVVVVSPSHTVFFKGCAVYDGDGYQTPLGVVDIDKELSEKIASVSPQVYASSQGHASGSTRGEHALEVQLPFLQVALGKFKLVAIVMGDQEEESIRALGEVLGSTLRGTNSLLVASTDLSHFYPEKRARKLDQAIREAVEKYDAEQLLTTLGTGRGEACGGGPVASVLIATRRLGGDHVRFLDYTTSGETTGQFDEVVGYLSAAVVGGKKQKVTTVMGQQKAPPPRQADQLSEDDRQKLLKVAREAIRARLDNQKYEPEPDDRLDFVQGCFVTLKINGQLRGCIGQIRGRAPLYETVAEMAVQAAFEDPRFDPLTAEEFEKLDYEVSVLSPLRRVHDLEEIEIGRDGLLIKLDWHSGLLLPQVATDHGFDRTKFLEETCLKAGLPRNSYKDKHAEIYKFSATVFSSAR